MPHNFGGNIQERYAKLDKLGRRCDANGRRCAGAAVERFLLIATDGHGQVKPEAKPEVRQCCSRHRAQFLLNGAWKLIKRESIATEPTRATA